MDVLKEQRVCIKFCQKLGIITGDESWVYVYDPETKYVVTVEDAVVTSTEESEASPAKCQDNADRFL
jgi:hypothetical protein